MLEPCDPERIGLLLFATMHRIAALVTAGSAPEPVDNLVADAIGRFLHGPRIPALWPDLRPGLCLVEAGPFRVYGGLAGRRNGLRLTPGEGGPGHDRNDYMGGVGRARAFDARGRE